MIALSITTQLLRSTDLETHLFLYQVIINLLILEITVAVTY